MDLNVVADMFTFAVGKKLISPPKMFPWQRKFNSPPTSSKLISSFFSEERREQTQYVTMTMTNDCQSCDLKLRLTYSNLILIFLNLTFWKSNLYLAFFNFNN